MTSPEQAMAPKKSAIEQLAEVLRGTDVQVRIGLRAQGHLPTVEKMLADGATWAEIGKAIGWHGPTAQKWFEMETKVSNV